MFLFFENRIMPEGFYGKNEKNNFSIWFVVGYKLFVRL